MWPEVTGSLAGWVSAEIRDPCTDNHRPAGSCGVCFTLYENVELLSGGAAPWSPGPKPLTCSPDTWNPQHLGECKDGWMANLGGAGPGGWASLGQAGLTCPEPPASQAIHTLTGGTFVEPPGRTAWPRHDVVCRTKDGGPRQ